MKEKVSPASRLATVVSGVRNLDIDPIAVEAAHAELERGSPVSRRVGGHPCLRFEHVLHLEFLLASQSSTSNVDLELATADDLELDFSILGLVLEPVKTRLVVQPLLIAVFADELGQLVEGVEDVRPTRTLSPVRFLCRAHGRTNETHLIKTYS